MTIRTYRRIGNISFGLAIAAVLCFDLFRNQLIPGAVLIGAGLLAFSLNAFARFRPLESNNLEVADSAPISDHESPSAAESLAIMREAQERRLAEGDRQPEPMAPDPAACIEAQILALIEAGAQDWHLLARRRQLTNRYFNRYDRHLYLARLEQQLGCPDWRAVKTAVAVARALSPQPTKYEVILTPDGTLKISPKSRYPQYDLQSEERVELPHSPGVPELVN